MIAFTAALLWCGLPVQGVRAEEPAGSPDASSESTESTGDEESSDDRYMSIEEAQQRHEEERRVQTIEMRGHFLGLQFDVGSSYAAGLGYSWAGSKRQFQMRGGGMARWWGVGPHVRTYTSDFEKFDAFEVGAHGRVVLTSILGIGLEAAAGLSRTDDRFQGTGLAGVFLPLWYTLELGYTYQIPLGPFERPDWLSSHQFSVRVNLPIYQWRVDDEKREPRRRPR